MASITYKQRLELADAQISGEWFPPDSKYWQARAKAAAKKLRVKIGRKAYRAFVDATIPDETTWKDCYELIEAELPK